MKNKYFSKYNVWVKKTKTNHSSGLLLWIVSDVIFIFFQNSDSFHLCLFDFHFIYQFYFLLSTLVKSAFWIPDGLLIFKSFQHHFNVCLLWFLHKKRSSFYTHLFCFTEMRWMFISSTAIWVYCFRYRFSCF